MPTAITHAFVAVAMGKAAFAGPKSWKFWGLAAACSALPDLDVGLFAYGVEYEDVWGHRGMTHSLLFAAALAVIVVTGLLRSEAKPFDKTWWTYVAFFFAVTASHGVLDAFTNGGLGIAFFSPFDTTRYFFPWTPIEVSPLGLSSLFSREGFEVLRSEFLWIWLPTISILLMILVGRWIARRRTAATTST